jgi:transposase
VPGEELTAVDLMHPRCAGIEVSKRDAKVCVRVAGRGRAGATSRVTTWGSFASQVLALREHLISEQVSLVVMEATGDYWKPFYYLLEDGPFEVMLVGARLVRPAGAGPPAAGPDPHPHRDRARARPGGPAAGEAAGGRDQAVLGGR